MPSTTQVSWEELTSLASKLEKPGTGPGSVPETEWRLIETALDTLLAAEDWNGIIRLRKIFRSLIARDTVGVLPLFKQLSYEAMTAAEQVGDKKELAHLLGADGHNLHRQGYHQEAIEVFEKSSRLYQEIDESFESLKSFYMTSLCYRALGNRSLARQILKQVLLKVDKDNPWRGNPLQVLAWLAQDDGQLQYAEQLLRESLDLQRQTKDPDILAAGTLADLGEVVGLQKRNVEAKELFERSLAILKIHEGQYDRQEARTKLKLAELTMREGNYAEALRLLDSADDKIRGYGHYYDLLWRIEMTRAFVFLRQGRWGGVIRKMRVVLHYRRELGLANKLFVQQLVNRLRVGTGLPR